MKKKIVLVLVMIALLVTLAACDKKADPVETPPSNSAETSTPTESAPETPEVSYDVNIGFIKGPSGVGAAYLLEQNELGESKNKYNVTIESDPSLITGAIISGDLDFAAVPTNVASVLYNKMNGEVRILAISTLDVLYILEKGDSVNSASDLAGKTIYATGQGANPEYVLNHMLIMNGLEPGKDVMIEFMDSAELATQMAAGELDICMLPVPNATSVLMKNSDVRKALSIGEEWNKVVTDGSVLTQGCVIARADCENLDEKVEAFLADYEESIRFMEDSANIDKAAELCVKYEIIPNAEVAKAAIPDCNITFVSGADTMKSYLSGYFTVLFEMDPTAIGGAIPDEAIYYKSGQ